MVEFYIVKQNELNNNWMVFSNCDQLINCYNGGGKQSAINMANELNIIANADFQKHFGGDISKLTFKVK